MAGFEAPGDSLTIFDCGKLYGEILHLCDRRLRSITSMRRASQPRILGGRISSPCRRCAVIGAGSAATTQEQEFEIPTGNDINSCGFTPSINLRHSSLEPTSEGGGKQTRNSEAQ